jgi:hypothetical protein
VVLVVSAARAEPVGTNASAAPHLLLLSCVISNIRLLRIFTEGSRSITAARSCRSLSNANHTPGAANLKTQEFDDAVMDPVIVRLYNPVFARGIGTESYACARWLSGAVHRSLTQNSVTQALSLICMHVTCRKQAGAGLFLQEIG